MNGDGSCVNIMPRKSGALRRAQDVSLLIVENGSR